MINILQVTLHQKDLEIQELEEKHKKFVDKAKSVVKSMDTKPVTLSDIDTNVLQNRLMKATKEIADLKVLALSVVNYYNNNFICVFSSFYYLKSVSLLN